MKMTMKKALLGTAIIAGTVFGGLSIASAAGGGDNNYEAKHMHWHFQGMRGSYDRAAAQRGYQVYREVCSACHQLKHLSFRHLGDEGAPYYDEHYKNPNDNPDVKAFAADWDIEVVDLDTGDMVTRRGVPADKFPPIYPNAAAAAASNNGKAPPDLSVIVKARPGGADYIYNVLTSYDKDDSMMNMMMGSQIAMATPLSDGRVEYADGTPATVEQMAKDVTEFLAWSADPKMEARKSLGFAVMLYLAILTILLWFAYRTVWRNVKH